MNRTYGWVVVAGCAAVSIYLSTLQPSPRFSSSIPITLTPVRALVLLWPLIAMLLWQVRRRRTRGTPGGLLLDIVFAADILYPLVWNVERYSPLYFCTLAVLMLFSFHRITVAVIAALLTAIFVNLCVLQGVHVFVVLAVLSGSAGLFAYYVTGRLRVEWARQTALFDQSRWAASELSSVTLHLGESLHMAKVQERLRERNRIAREIHDSTGHSLTALIVQIGIVKEMVRGGPAYEQVRAIEHLASVTLKELRNEVSLLRSEAMTEQEPVDWLQRIHQLSDVFAECTGIQINVNVSSGLALHGPEGEEVYHICQESITNAYRHGRASLIDISMEVRDGRRLLMRISDNGRGCRKIILGNGLRGIMERVDLLRGEVAFQTREDRGFDIGVVIPWPLQVGQA